MDERKKYYKEVFQKSEQQIKAALGVRGDTMKLAAGIIFTAVILVALLAIGILNEIEDVWEILLFLFGANVLFVIILRISTPVIAFFNMPRAAAKMHDKQKKELDSYQDTKLKMHISDFQINSYSPGIEIFEILATNNGQNEIVKIAARIESVIQHTLSEDGELITSAKRDGVMLDGTGQIEIRPGTSSPIAIDSSPDDLTSIEFGQSTGSVYLSSVSVFSIEVSFSGTLRGEEKFRTKDEGIDLYCDPSKNLIGPVYRADDLPGTNQILIEKVKGFKKRMRGLE